MQEIYRFQGSSNGFSLIELMTALAVLLCLTLLGAPTFKQLHESWKVKQTTDSLSKTLYLARSMAIQQGGRIGIQKNAKGTGGCTLANTNQEWGCGWFIFVDENDDGKWQNSERKLQVFTPEPNTNVIHQSGGTNIKVDRNGMMSGLNAKGFVISPEPAGIGSPATRGLCMSSGGRIRVIEDIPCK